MTQDYGKQLLDLLRSELEKEEGELKSSGHSIREYSEYWLQFLLFKASLRTSEFPQVVVENDKIDGTILYLHLFQAARLMAVRRRQFHSHKEVSVALREGFCTT